MQVVGSAFMAFVVAVVVFQKIRSRKVGPRVGWIPRGWRPAVNRYYSRFGVREPYDADGNARPWWEPVDGVTSPADDRAARVVHTAIAVVVVLGAGVVLVALAFG